MNREAAALGVPVYTTYGGRLGGVDEQLIRDGRLLPLTDPRALDLHKRSRRRRAARGAIRRSCSTCCWRSQARRPGPWVVAVTRSTRADRLARRRRSARASPGRRPRSARARRRAPAGPRRSHRASLSSKTTYAGTSSSSAREPPDGELAQAVAAVGTNAPSSASDAERCRARRRRARSRNRRARSTR